MAGLPNPDADTGGDGFALIGAQRSMRLAWDYPKAPARLADVFKGGSNW